MDPQQIAAQELQAAKDEIAYKAAQTAKDEVDARIAEAKREALLVGGVLVGLWWLFGRR